MRNIVRVCCSFIYSRGLWKILLTLITEAYFFIHLVEIFMPFRAIFFDFFASSKSRPTKAFAMRCLLFRFLFAYSFLKTKMVSEFFWCLNFWFTRMSKAGYFVYLNWCSFFWREGLSMSEYLMRSLSLIICRLHS